MRKWLSDLQAHDVRVLSGDVAAAADGAVQIHGLVIETQTPLGGRTSLKVTFGDVLLKGADESPSLLRVGQAHIDKLQVAFDDGRLDIEAVDFKNLALPRSIEAHADPQRPMASIMGFARALLTTHVGAVTLTNMGWTPPDAAAGASAALASLSADTIDAGAVAAVRASDFRWRSPENETRIGDLALTQVSLPAFLSMVDPQSYRAATLERPWKSILGHANLHALDVRAAGARTALREIDLGPLQGRQFAFDPTPILDIAANAPAKLNEQPKLKAQIADGFAANLKIAKATASGLDFGDAAEPPTRRTEMDAVEIVDLTPRTAKSIALSGLRSVFGDAGLRIATLSAADVDLASHETPGNDEPATSYPKFSQLALERIAFVRPGVNAAVGSAKIAAHDYVGRVPTHVDASVTGVAMPVDNLPDNVIKANLAALNVDALNADANLSFAWQETTETLEVSSAQVAVAGLGALTATVSVSPIPRAAFEAPQSWGDLAIGSGVQQARLTFQDAGLAARVIAKFAEVNKITPEKVRGGLTANMPTILGAIADAPSRNRLIFAAIGFLNNPKSISLFTTLESAVPLAKIMETWRASPQNLPGLLRLDAVANRPS